MAEEIVGPEVIRTMLMLHEAHGGFYEQYTMEQKKHF
jgi:hypothetical protein